MSSENLSIIVNVLQALANIGILITIFLLARQTRASVEATKEAQYLRIAEIYRSINLQFDDIISHLPPEINDFPDLASLRHLSEQPGFSPGQAEKAIWRYYEMVRMEFELCRMGVLTDHMWRGWLRGITSSFRFPAFCEIWERQSEAGRSKPQLAKDPEFQTFMQLARDDPDTLFGECGTVEDLIKWTKSLEENEE